MTLHTDCNALRFFMTYIFHTCVGRTISGYLSYKGWIRGGDERKVGIHLRKDKVDDEEQKSIMIIAVATMRKRGKKMAEQAREGRINERQEEERKKGREGRKAERYYLALLDVVTRLVASASRSRRTLIVFFRNINNSPPLSNGSASLFHFRFGVPFGLFRGLLLFSRELLVFLLSPLRAADELSSFCRNTRKLQQFTAVIKWVSKSFPLPFRGAACPFSETPMFPGTPRTFLGTPRIFPGTPRISPGTPRIFTGTPLTFLGTPRISPGTPRISPGTLRISPGTPRISRATLPFRSRCLHAHYQLNSRCRMPAGCGSSTRARFVLKFGVFCCDPLHELVGQPN